MKRSDAFELICPKCGNRLIKRGNSLYCGENHCYDVAKTGYVNFVFGGKKESGDAKELIEARERVMKNGYYSALYDFVKGEFSFGAGDVVVDAGTGDGSFAGKLKEFFPLAAVAGTDLSKYAISRAAKKYPAVFFAVANNRRLPFADSSLKALFGVFTTAFPEEAARVIAKGGFLVKITPGKNHLLGLKRALYENVRLNEEDESVPAGFTREKTIRLRGVYNAVGEEIKDLAGMTPYSVKSPRESLERLYNTAKLDTEIEFRADVFRKE